MTSKPQWPNGPYYFLEAKDTESDVNAGRPLTICDLATSSDLANVYSKDDSTIATTREQAVAISHLFAAAPELYEALYGLIHGHDGAIEAGRSALAKARGEQ